MYIQINIILIYTVSQKNDSDVARYNFNAHQPILVILAEMLLREYAMDAHLFSHTVSRK